MVTANRPKDLYRSFYTKCDHITKFMVSQLELGNGDRVLEPAAGDGVFIDQILGCEKRVNIVAYEIDPAAIKQLNQKYVGMNNIEINCGDALTDENLTVQAEMGLTFDKIIANPPYGGWQDYERRKKLKTLFPGFYVRETYALFLIKCIALLKNGGILSFIIPDTFLNVHMHKNLRKSILENTAIKNMALIPSNFFPLVDFGYANLAIITLQKSYDKDSNLRNDIRIIRDVESVDMLDSLEKNKAYRVSFMRQKEVLETADHAFLVNGAKKLRTAINNAVIKIGDIANCVTGFYSGDNSKFLRVSPSVTRNLSNCQLIDKSDVPDDYISRDDLLEGISGKKAFIPIVKGGSEPYLKKDSWFVDWSKEAVAHYKACRKARFQNSQFYFKIGIAVPMVTSSKVTASLIEQRLFDQSIVGIFPKDKNLLLYLLGFFNSAICTKILKMINHTANNSSNYIKKIPFLPPAESEITRINALVKDIVHLKRKEGMTLENNQKQIDSFFDEKYKAFLH